MDNYLSDKIKAISFISIILVVFLHSYNLDLKQNGILISFEKSYVWFFENFVSYGFTRIAVPMFFIISGYLFFLNHESKKESFVFKIKKRITTLVIPYFIWSLFGILFYFILQSIPQLQSFFNKGLIKNYSISEWLTTMFISPIAYQLWFIRDLFLIICLSPILFYSIKFFWQLLLFFLLVLWGCDFDMYNNSIEALLFFYIGSFISLKKTDYVLVKNNNPIKVMFFLWFSLVSIKVYLEYFDYPNWTTYLLLKLSILVGIVFIWHLYDKYEDKLKLILNYTSYTFFIYASHEPILTTYKKLLFFVIGKGEVAFLTIYIMAPLFTILTSLVLGHILKSFAPLLYKIIVGNR